MEMDKALLVTEPCPPASPPIPWQPRNLDAIFMPDYFFNRKKAAKVPMTFRTVNPVTSIPIAFFPHPTSRTSSPAHTVACPPPAHTVAHPPPVFLDLKRLINEDAKMLLNPFREHIPHLRRLPLLYMIKAQGNWKLHHYSNNLAPHIRLPLLSPYLIEIQHSLHPSIAYTLPFDSFTFCTWKFLVGQEVVFGDVRPPTGTYRFVQLLPSDSEGPMERVLALCMRDNGTGYYECNTELPPV